MRSPERKGTVPSLAMSVPSKASTMSPRFSTCPRARSAPRAARTRPSARPARAAPALSRPALRNRCKAFPWLDRRGSVCDQPMRLSASRMRYTPCAQHSRAGASLSDD